MKLFWLFLLCILLHASKWNGIAYQQNNALHNATVRELLHSTSINNNEIIADLGCGTGEITAYLASLVPDGFVIGLDYAPDMLAIARTSYQQANICFQEQDITNWSIEIKFDRITAFSCLHWIENIQPILNNCAYSLKNNGIFMATIAHKRHFLYTPFLSTAAQPQWTVFFGNTQKPWFPYTKKSFAQLLHNANLKPIVVKTFYEKHYFSTKQAFANWVNSWIVAVVPLQQIPTALQQAFTDEVIETFLKNITLNPDGSFEISNPVLLALAQKTAS